MQTILLSFYCACIAFLFGATISNPDKIIIWLNSIAAILTIGIMIWTIREMGRLNEKSINEMERLNKESNDAMNEINEETNSVIQEQIGRVSEAMNIELLEKQREREIQSKEKFLILLVAGSYGSHHDYQPEKTWNYLNAIYSNDAQIKTLERFCKDWNMVGINTMIDVKRMDAEVRAYYNLPRPQTLQQIIDEMGLK